MVAIQLSIPTSEALLRIRAHAFANDLSVAEVAAQIVSGACAFPTTATNSTRRSDHVR